MKKSILFIVLLVIVLSLSAGKMSFNSKMPTFFSSDANYLYKKDFQSLYDFSDAVLIAKTNQKIEDRDTHITYFKNPIGSNQSEIEDIYTSTTITIKKVLKDEDVKLKNHENIKINEPFGKIGKDKYDTINNYLPIEPNKIYILFLKKNANG